MTAPREYDVVRLLRALPEHDLPIGATGTVVIDHSMHSTATSPAYEVEFVDADGFTRAVVTVPRDDLEVTWRPHA